MLDFLKELPNILLYFIVWGFLAYRLKKNKHKLASLVIVLGVLVFLVSATSYIPKRLIASIERVYDPIQLEALDPSKTYHLHVLGSGASNDSRLPPLLNLNESTLSRLAEGIRLYTYLEHAVLVTSAGNTKGLKSQAEISKETAISLGVKEEAIEMLETPTTTLEEAIAFKARFGTDKNLILITSALHMPRAVEIFADQGLTVIPAPSNYFYKTDERGNNGLTLPSFESLVLMNTYHTTVLKQWYYRVFKKE